MERMLPPETAEPMVRGTAASAALRTTLYGALALALGTGAWLRFNPQVAAFVPALAGPAAMQDARFAESDGMKGLIELAMLPAASAPEAVAGMALPAEDAALLTAALRRGRYRLVQIPLVDASPPPPDGLMVTHAVEVSAAGYTRVVQLSRVPLTVTVPVGPVGAVSFRTAGADGVAIGALGLAGPMTLPPLHPGQVIAVGVIAQ